MKDAPTSRVPGAIQAIVGRFDEASARATSGQNTEPAAAAPPSSVMNSRRLIR
jgi:hypothetical protein